MSGTYLLVGVCGERYAIPADDVLEVGLGTDPAALPGAPSDVLGLQNIRGQVVPLVDLAPLVGGGSPATGQAMVVVEHDGRRAALAVDTLIEVAPLDIQSIREETGETGVLHSSVLADGALVGVVDIEAALDRVGATAR